MKENNSSMIQKTNSFALGQYNTSMTTLQLKLQALVFAQISADEDPLIDKEYSVQTLIFKKELGIKGNSFNAHMVASVKKLLKSDPTIAFRSGNKTIVTHIFQNISIPDNSSVVYIRLTTEIRKHLIAMKKLYDIQYPVKTILSLNCKYSPLLYDFLLAHVDSAKRNGTKGDTFTVITTPDELTKFFNYTGTVGNFNKVALKPAVKDLNKHSEIYVDNDMPDFVYEGRKLVQYRFKITLRANVAAPMFTLNMPVNLDEIETDCLSEVPELEYTLEYLAAMHVDDRYLGKLRRENNPEKAWRTLLYCWFQDKDTPAYFNAAYEKNFAAGTNLQEMFQYALDQKRLLPDGVAAGILKYYQDKLRFVEIPGEPLLDDTLPGDIPLEERRQRLMEKLGAAS